jgi:hypothetical protein
MPMQGPGRPLTASSEAGLLAARKRLQATASLPSPLSPSFLPEVLGFEVPGCNGASAGSAGLTPV